MVGDRLVKAVTIDECDLALGNGDMSVLCGDAEEKPWPARKSGPLVLVRLFTPWLLTRDLNLPAWRILVQQPDGTFEERPAHEFTMTGSWFGFRYNFPAPTGPKMHIGGFGTVTWDGNRAIITTS
jgi:hypothetical protein